MPGKEAAVNFTDQARRMFGHFCGLENVCVSLCSGMIKEQICFSPDPSQFHLALPGVDVL